MRERVCVRREGSQHRLGVVEGYGAWSVGWRRGGDEAVWGGGGGGEWRNLKLAGFKGVWKVGGVRCLSKKVKKKGKKRGGSWAGPKTASGCPFVARPPETL